MFDVYRIRHGGGARHSLIVVKYGSFYPRCAKSETKIRLEHFFINGNRE